MQITNIAIMLATETFHCYFKCMLRIKIIHIWIMYLYHRSISVQAYILHDRVITLQCNLVNTLRLRPFRRRHFWKCIFFKGNAWISLKYSLMLLAKCPINNIPLLFQIMAWQRPGGNLSSEPVMVISPTHVCVTLPQWVKLNESDRMLTQALS